jgi:hypothetical protein
MRRRGTPTPKDKQTQFRLAVVLRLDTARAAGVRL